MTPYDAPAWRVHLGTADITCVRLSVRLPGSGDPWPLSSVMGGLMTMGAERADRPHAAGAGRGVPIVHRQSMTWRACAVHLEAHRVQEWAEVSMELPSWDELVERVDGEDAVWELIDVVADACAARWGAIGDGEALGDVPDLRRHCGVLVPPYNADGFGITRPYALLERSGLAVLLR